MNARPFGASLDGVAAQKSFHTAQKLNFPLLSDPGGKAASQFGALPTGGGFSQRVTIVIDPEGVVRHVERQVKVDSHGKDLVALIRKLQGEAAAADLRPSLKRWGLEGGPGPAALAGAVAHALASRTGKPTPLSADYLSAVSGNAMSLADLVKAFEKSGVCPAADMRGSKKVSKKAEQGAAKIRELAIAVRWIAESGSLTDEHIAEARRRLAAGWAVLAQGKEAVLLLGFAEGAFVLSDGKLSFEAAKKELSALAWIDASKVSPE